MRINRILSILSAAVLVSCGMSETEYDASGVFEVTDIVVAAETSGKIVSLSIEEGQPVKQGEILGCVDTVQLSLKKRQLLATRSATEEKTLNIGKQLASLNRQIEIEEQELVRFRRLLEAGAATGKQVDDIQNKIEVLRQQREALADQIGSSNRSVSEQGGSVSAQVAQIEDQISKSQITSPISGIVMTKYAEQGEFAIPGKAIFKVADIRLMKLRAYVTADQLTNLKLGQKVKVYADKDADGYKEYPGTVSWISSKAEFTPKTIQTRDERANLVYAVKITVVNDGFIKQGMYGDVKFK